MSYITCRAYFPASLRALLTSSVIMKLGYDVKQCLMDIATIFDDPEIHQAIKAHVATLDLGYYAKLKGMVSDPYSSLHVLVGSILKNSFSPPLPTNDPWSSDYTKILHDHVECIWQVYVALGAKDSVGLPLLPYQAQTDGQCVTVCQADKPVAQGVLIWPHAKSLDSPDDEDGNSHSINITASRSLVRLTKLLAPATLHSLHGQSLEWIFNHGALAVVTSSTLRTRSEADAVSASPVGHGLGVPAPTPKSLPDENLAFTLSLPTGDAEFSQDVDFGDESLDEEEMDNDGQFDLLVSDIFYRPQ